MASSIFEIASGLWFPSFLQFLSLANARDRKSTDWALLCSWLQNGLIWLGPAKHLSSMENLWRSLERKEFWIHVLSRFTPLEFGRVCKSGHCTSSETCKRRVSSLTTAMPAMLCSHIWQSSMHASIYYNSIPNWHRTQGACSTIIRTWINMHRKCAFYSCPSIRMKHSLFAKGILMVEGWGMRNAIGWVVYRLLARVGTSYQAWSMIWLSLLSLLAQKLLGPVTAAGNLSESLWSRFS